MFGPLSAYFLHDLSQTLLTLQEAGVPTRPHAVVWGHDDIMQPYHSFYDTSLAWRVPRQRRGTSGDGAPARVRLASTIVREGLGYASCSKG